MQPDIVYRPWMLTDRAKELDGRTVRVSGYMWGGSDRFAGLKEFILLRNTECKFGPGGQFDPGQAARGSYYQRDGNKRYRPGRRQIEDKSVSGARWEHLVDLRPGLRRRNRSLTIDADNLARL